MNVIGDLGQISLGLVEAAGLIVLVVALICYDTVWGVRSHRAFLAALQAAPASDAEAVRTRFLLRWAWQPWVLTVAALVLVAISPTLRFADLGLRLPTLPAIGDDGWSVMVGAAIGIVLVAVAILAIAWRRRRTGDEREVPVEPQVNAQVEPMLPTGRTDRRAWLLLSFTAGVTEEIMYRGVLLLTLAALLPMLDPLVICAIAVLVFAAAHIYQGWAGMLVTGLVAVPLLALYLMSGSLLPGMVLHFALDARAALTKPASSHPS